MCRQHAWDGDDCPYCDIDRLTKENDYLRYNSRKYYHGDGSFNVLESEDEVIERRKSAAKDNKILRQRNDNWLEECEQLKAERDRLRDVVKETIERLDTVPPDRIEQEANRQTRVLAKALKSP